MWDHHYHSWLSTTKIRRRREPTNATRGCYYANTIVCRRTWRTNWWPNYIHAGSTQYSRAFRDLSPSCPATINTINYVFARVGRALLQVLLSSNAPAFSCNGTQISFTTKQHSPPQKIVIQDPNSTWKRTNHFSKIILSKHHRVSRHLSPSGRLEP